jgi:hypothetical protein
MNVMLTTFDEQIPLLQRHSCSLMYVKEATVDEPSGRDLG